MTKSLLLLFAVFLTRTLTAQEKIFQFSGSPIVTLFANVHTGIGSANEEAGFELERSYLGYAFRVTKELSGKVIFDIGPSKVEGSDLERIAYVKNAMLSWQIGNLTLDFGLVPLVQFNIQEKFWGYRYIRKSFQDEYKFNSSADMGVIGKYKFTPWLSADLNFINGEGYKKINRDNHFRYGAGITLTPYKNLLFRIYGDRYNGNGGESKDQYSAALFLGYRNKRFHAGAEYNRLFNAGFNDEQNRTGYSAYTSVNLSSKFTLFVRYDRLSSSHNDSPDDQQFGLAGLQYSPNKYLRLSPNYRIKSPGAGKNASYLYLNVYFNL